VEAVAHFRRSLDLLRTLPESSEHLERELALQISLGVAIAGSKGWADPEAERANVRARELCSNVAESPQLFVTLQGLAAGACLRADIRTSLALTRQALSLAERLDDPTLLVIGHFGVGDQLFWFPELTAARQHLEEGMSRFEPHRDRTPALTVLGWDPAVGCLTFCSRILWHLGYPDQAAACVDRAMATAAEIAHPFSRSWALSWGAALYHLRREAQRVRQLADATVALASEQAISLFNAHGMVLGGWALVNQGRGEEGLAQLRSGIAAYRATGARIECSHWLGLLAEACGEANQSAEGLRALDVAFAEIQRNDMRYYEAELHRLRGELLLKQDVASGHAAEASFRQAIDIARSQQAKALELRAATSLARLWQRQGKPDDARGLLGVVYDWFTEGFATKDLLDARALLDSLA
jgi:predicted ATPase